MPVDTILDAVARAPAHARVALMRLIGPCLILGAAGRVTHANDAAAELFALDRGSLVGKSIQAFTPRDARPALRSELGKAVRDDADGRTFFTRFERGSGGAFDAEVRAARIGPERGREATLILAVRDVSHAVENAQQLWELNSELEQRIAERTAELEFLSEELERRRAYLETIVQHIPAGVVIADATGDVMMVNERSRVISGVGPDEPLPRRVAWMAAQATRADGTAYRSDEWPLARALAGEEVLHERITVEQAAGMRTVLEVNAAPVRNTRGDVVAAVALFQDVTDADRLARAAADFVANAAHELRTPLAAIVSGIDVLEAGAKEIPAERDRFLAHLGREAGRLARLSSALLLLARLQSGIEQARSEIVPLAPVIASVAAGLRPADGVLLAIRCSNEAAAIASRGLLEQALTGVAVNAVRYTEAGRITLSVAHPNGGVRIRVRDTGRGMTPETVARAGERFYRGDPAGPGGFGLGLAIARESVEAMGGSLVLESTLGEGTTADILLPAARVVAT